MLIDTHTHLDYKDYNEDREIVIQRALESGLAAIITIGTDIPSSDRALHLAEKYATVFAAVGVHPTDCANTTKEDLKEIEKLAAHEKVIAIGEVGLDYYHMRAEKDKQIDVFRQQIELANQLKLPLIIHNRDSHEDMLQVLQESESLLTGGVMHSFTGTGAFQTKVLELGLHISFTGNITFKKSDSDDLVKQAPLDRLLLETDSPFLTPVPMRGKRNEPAFLVHTAQKIAELKDVPYDDICKITSENAISLFKLNI